MAVGTNTTSIKNIIRGAKIMKGNRGTKKKKKGNRGTKK
jgi:hypothetical protein